MAVKEYNIGKAGQQVIKAPKQSGKVADAGKRAEGKDLRTGK